MLPTGCKWLYQLTLSPVICDCYWPPSPPALALSNFFIFARQVNVHGISQSCLEFSWLWMRSNASLCLWTVSPLLYLCIVSLFSIFFLGWLSFPYWFLCVLRRSACLFRDKEEMHLYFQLLPWQGHCPCKYHQQRAPPPLFLPGSLSRIFVHTFFYVEHLAGLF